MWVRLGGVDGLEVGLAIDLEQFVLGFGIAGIGGAAQPAHRFRFIRNDPRSLIVAPA